MTFIQVSSWGRVANLLDYALSSLRRKLVKNLLVFVVFTLVVFLFGSFQLTSRALIRSAQQVLSTAPDITVQQMSAGRQVPISITSTSQLDTIFGIKKIVPRIWGYYFDEDNGANYTVIGSSERETAVDHRLADSLQSGGRFPSTKGPDDAAAEVVVSSRVAELLQLDGRSFFSLFRPNLSQKSFRVVGLFADNLDILTADLILMDIKDARDLFAVPAGYVTDLLIDCGNPAEVDTIARKISEKLAGSRVITRNQILKTYRVVFNWRSGLGMICLLTALVAFVILAWDKASGLSSEDMREIGILKLVGWQTSDIITLRFFESLVVSGLAFTVGYLLSWLHVSLFDGLLFRPILLGWSVLQPQLTLSPDFAVSDLLLILSISVVPYLCATAIPGWRAAAVRADSVI